MSTTPPLATALRMASQRLAMGDLEGAEALLDEQVGVDAPQLDALRAQLQLARGQAHAARGHLERALQRMPERIDLRALWVQCLVQCGDLEAARVASDADLAAEPGSPECRYARGLLEVAQTDFGKAAEQFLAVTSAVPSHWHAWILLGQASHSLGRHADAERAFRAASHLQPEHAYADICLAALYLDEERFALALQHAQRATHAWPGMATGWVLQSRGLQGLKQVEPALVAARRAAELSPRDPQALLALGMALQLGNRMDEAALAFRDAAAQRFGVNAVIDPSSREHRQTTRAKLRHDIEQYHYLAAVSGDLRFDNLAKAHASVLADLPPGQETEFVDLSLVQRKCLGGGYNRLHRLASADRLSGGALNPSLDGRVLEAAYLERAPGIGWIDGLLRPEALACLRRYCLQSTFWFDFHHTGGYLGASLQNGFAAPLLLQIADELRALLPNVIGEHPLTQLWAFKYDSELEGIKLHADLAAVNLNFWITPDDANLDPDSGGLVLWDKEAPLAWGFDQYNASSESGQARIRDFLRESGAKEWRVAHRQNRAVLFNSDLFHATDRIRFKSGYEQRRINITMLFGWREGPS